MYFGFCFKSFGIPKFLKRKRFIKYHPKATGLAPHCLHAYAVTVAGASKLLELVKECGPPADHQIAEFANKGLITYKYSNISYSPDFTTKEFAKHGIHLKVLLHVILNNTLLFVSLFFTRKMRLMEYFLESYWMTLFLFLNLRGPRAMTSADSTLFSSC